FGVLPDHAPMVAALGFGFLTVRVPGEGEQLYCTGDGLFEVDGNRAYVLVNTVEFCDEIDVERAEAAKGRAEKRLKENPENLDIERARAALFRSITRLKIAEKK
ncbi:MAG: ATP synthase delta/epsilon chain alpha-helix domain-containing protein, partial [bacterium]